MATFKLLLAEIRYRKLNFCLSLLAVVAAATLFVAGSVLIGGYSRQTQRMLADMTNETKTITDEMDQRMAKMDDDTRKLMIAMGFNLMIVHKDTNMADFWAADFADKDLPQKYVETLAESPKLKHVRHLVATLQKKIEWRKRKVMLVGYLSEITQTHFKTKKPMGYNIKPGEVYLGYELWRQHGLSEGDKVDVRGHEFTVGRTQTEKGDKKDIEISLNLADAQRVLEMPGRVNQIMALGCKCEGERLPTIRKELAAVLPDTKITEFGTIAQARAEQRELVGVERQLVAENGQRQRDLVGNKRADVQQAMETLAVVGAPLVVLVCGVWIGLLAFLNVRERRAEIGLLRALGSDSARIATLFLGRAILVGFFGGGLGYLVGSLVAGQFVVQQFKVSAPADYSLLLWTAVGAPLVCAVACYLPTLRAIFQDPAVVLRDA